MLFGNDIVYASNLSPSQTGEIDTLLEDYCFPIFKNIENQEIADCQKLLNSLDDLSEANNTNAKAILAVISHLIEQATSNTALSKLTTKNKSSDYRKTLRETDQLPDFIGYTVRAILDYNISTRLSHTKELTNEFGKLLYSSRSAKIKEEITRLVDELILPAIQEDQEEISSHFNDIIEAAKKRNKNPLILNSALSVMASLFEANLNLTKPENLSRSNTYLQLIQINKNGVDFLDYSLGMIYEELIRRKKPELAAKLIFKFLPIINQSKISYPKSRLFTLGQYAQNEFEGQLIDRWGTAETASHVERDITQRGGSRGISEFLSQNPDSPYKDDLSSFAVQESGFESIPYILISNVLPKGNNDITIAPSNEEYQDVSAQNDSIQITWRHDFFTYIQPTPVKLTDNTYVDQSKSVTTKKTPYISVSYVYEMTKNSEGKTFGKLIKVAIKPQSDKFGKIITGYFLKDINFFTKTHNDLLKLSQGILTDINDITSTLNNLLKILEDQNASAETYFVYYVGLPKNLESTNIIPRELFLSLLEGSKTRNKIKLINDILVKEAAIFLTRSIKINFEVPTSNETVSYNCNPSDKIQDIIRGLNNFLGLTGDNEIKKILKPSLIPGGLVQELDSQKTLTELKINVNDQLKAISQLAPAPTEPQQGVDYTIPPPVAHTDALPPPPPGARVTTDPGAIILPAAISAASTPPLPAAPPAVPGGPPPSRTGGRTRADSHHVGPAIHPAPASTTGGPGAPPAAAAAASPPAPPPAASPITPHSVKATDQRAKEQMLYKSFRLEEQVRKTWKIEIKVEGEVTEKQFEKALKKYAKEGEKKFIDKFEIEKTADKKQYFEITLKEDDDPANKQLQNPIKFNLEEKMFEIHEPTTTTIHAHVFEKIGLLAKEAGFSVIRLDDKLSPKEKSNAYQAFMSVGKLTVLGYVPIQRDRDVADDIARHLGSRHRLTSA